MDIVPETSQQNTSENAPEFTFDLLIIGITRQQAETILDLILAKADEFGGEVGGGFVETKLEAQDGEENA
jgi:hypothetical protein